MPPESTDNYPSSNEIDTSAAAPATHRSWLLKPLLFFGITLFIFISVLWYLSSAPTTFPEDSTINIDKGSSVTKIVTTFAESKYVRSSDLLHAVLIIFHDAADIKAGVYTFAEPLSVFGVARIITETGPSEPLKSITFPEGLTTAAYVAIAKRSLPNFDETTFLALAEDKEGYLFPDTYFVPTTFTAPELYQLLTETFERKVSDYQSTITDHSLTLDEIITLASIIEREANSPESMRMVAGILLNRLAIGMPLQADASIEYVLDVPLKDLPPGQLAIELKKNDSPYNTYLNPGLPPTPIGNPGLVAITAVLEPTESDYFFYLTDENGDFYYARTLEEHNLNVARYLR